MPEAVAEDLPGRVGAGLLGAEVAPAGANAATVTLYAADREAAAELALSLGAELRSLGVDATPTIREIRDDRWVEAYQAGLRPLPLGRRFVVLPGDDHRAPPERDPIVLVPGRAFGTGEHPTTRLCAAALEAVVEPGSRWLDLGTGSGVLAVVASRCGARRVDAVDVDPDAVEVAREVVARNAAAGGVEVRTGSADSLDDGAYDGVVANISEVYFLTRAADIARVLRPGGRLVASGFLVEDAADVVASLARAGLVAVGDRAEEGEWSACVAVRDEEGPA